VYGRCKTKQAAQKFDVERSNLRKLNKLKVRKQYQIKFSNMSAVLENLSDNEDINRAWENIKENVRTRLMRVLGLYKLKQCKLWFDEILLVFLDQRKQATMQWLQDPNQSNVNNLNNIRLEACGYIRSKDEEYQKDKSDDVGAWTGLIWLRTGTGGRHL
jgi:flagellar biosynthesis component FlhA